MSGCYSDRRKWWDVKHKITSLRAWARGLAKKADAPLRRELWYVLKDLDILEEDLRAWGQDEEVCWHEFDSKLAQVEARLRDIQKLMALRVRV